MRSRLRLRPLRLETLEDRRLLANGSDPAVDLEILSFDWNRDRDDPALGDRRGVDVTYAIHGGPLPAETTIAFFWSSSDQLQGILGGPLTPHDVTGMEGSDSVPFNEEALWGKPPPGAAYVLAVADPPDAEHPAGRVLELDEDNNVRALRLHSPAEILENSVGIPTASGGAVETSFQPGGGSWTMSEAEVALGVDHFNWYQTFVGLDYQWAMHIQEAPLSVPVPPPGGTYRLPPQPWVDPPVTPRHEFVWLRSTYTQALQSFGTGDLDALPYFWNEGSLADGSLGLHRFTRSTSLAFADEPTVARELFRDDNDFMQFTTMLVGVRADGSPEPLPHDGQTAFAWKYSPAAGVFDVQRIDNAPPEVRDDLAVIDIFKTGDPGLSYPIDVLANDVDYDGSIDPATLTIQVPPSDGTVSVDRETGLVSYTPYASFMPIDSFTYSVRDREGGLSRTGTVSIWGNRLNPVVFQTIPDLTPSAGDVEFCFTTWYPGVLTAEISFLGPADSAHLALFDADHNPVAPAWPTGGDWPRIDCRTNARATYFVRVSGTSPNVVLRLANVLDVSPDGKSLLAYGTTQNICYEFRAGPPPSLWVNGLRYGSDFFPALELMTLDGMGREDIAFLTGSTGDDVATLRPNAKSLTLPGCRIDLRSVESIAVEGNGGNDVARLDDSASMTDNTFRAGPTSATMAGAGFSWTVDHFRYCFAYAGGGNDTAMLTDSGGNDTLVADLTEHDAYLSGKSFYLRCEQFDSVRAGSTGGIDVARLYDSPKDDLFAGTPASACLSGNGFSCQADNFRYVIGFASAGNDQATLQGSDQTDTFLGTPTYAVMSAASYTHRVSSFESVVARGSPGGADVARLYDSPGDDAFAAYPTQATLAGSGFSLRADDFRYVQAYSTAGGADQADLYDSSALDTFTASPTYAAMYAASYYNRANYFESVVGHSSGGNDLARLYDSPGDDLFDAYPSYAVLSGAGFSNRAEAFRYLAACADAGGIDVARLHGSSGNDTVTSTCEYTRFQAGTADISARSFETVTVDAGNGGQDKVTLYDSPNDDRLEAADHGATLSYPDRLVQILDLTSAARLIAVSSRGGHDTKQEALHDFILETQGPWTPL